MKKLFAMLMAVVMIFSLATVAFAEEAEAPAAGHGLVSEETTYTAVIKAYDVTGGTILPVETLEFVSVADTTNPDGGVANLTIAPLAVTAATMNLDITVPSFSEVGTYHFTITETAGEAQGAVYSDGEIYVSVLVTFNYEEKKLEEMDIMCLVDRFGYVRTIDMAAYERNREAAEMENKYVFSAKNTGRICIFTNTGQLHTIKVMDLPFGRFRDKGIPLDNVSNYSSEKEDIIIPILQTGKLRLREVKRLARTTQHKRGRAGILSPPCAW